jgi:hypothetical protein
MSAARKVETTYSSNVEWVKADTIELGHPELQRPLDGNHAKRIAEKFDPDMLGKPLVVAFPSKGGEHLVAVDGQHRIAAVKIALGLGQMIECEVVRGVTVAHAARMFSGRNFFKRPQAIDLFLKSVTGGDEESVAINRILTSLGLKIGVGQVDGYVNCVNALQRIYRGDGRTGMGKNELALKRTLGTALRAWGKASTSFQGMILHGIGLVVLKHGDVIDFEALEQKLAAFPKGPIGLLGKAKGSRETMGGSVPQNVASTIVREYNKGRRKSTVPDWFTAT